MRDVKRPARIDPHRLLIAVCALFVLVSTVLVPPTLALGWDEIVYASRFPPHGPGPEVPFSAPRTRGVPLLIAPVAAFSDSVGLLRCYLTLAAALALYLGFRPWLALAARAGFPAGTVPLAAGLYGGLWTALFYAGAAMPNHYVATGLACAVGCFLRVLDGAGGRAYAGLVGGLAAAALMRPHDAVWPGLVLLAAVPLLAAGRRAGRRRVRWRLSGAVCGGLALGLVPWAVEAWLRFGGVRERLREASGVQGGMSPAFSLPEHAAALDGPLLCRPCGAAGTDWASAGWWLLLPPLVALGLWAARAAGRLAWAALPVAAALAVAVPYLFFLDYAAPRFLLPAYALLAPVAAAGACAALRARALRARRVLLPVAAVLLVSHLAYQAHQAGLHSGIQAGAREDWRRMERLLRAHGVEPPCVLRGNSSVIPVAHVAGCAAGEGPAGPGRASALVLRGRPLPAWAVGAGWRAFPVPGTYNPGWRIAVPPGEGAVRP
ncbi:hypothetical protein [Streptomyces albiaxialis]